MPKRRAHSTGSVTRRGAQSYRVQIRLGLDPASGEYRRYRFTVNGTRKDAETALREALNRIERGTDIVPDKITLGDYLARWLTDYAEPNVARSTIRRYRQLVGRWAEMLGGVRLQELRPTHIQAAYRTLEYGDESHRPLKRRTVHHHHRVLSQALRQAVRWQLINVNPADATTPPRPEAREMRTLSAGELRRLLNSTTDPVQRRLTLLAVQTGARLGELLALRWSDVDFERGRASIQRSLDYYTVSEGPSFTTPKTQRSRRSIALSDDTLRVLREHKTAQAEHRLSVGPDWEDYDLVFPDPLGAPSRKFHVSRNFSRTAAQAGFEGIRFHDLRHTAATLMLKANVHPKVVSERLGHSTVAITLDTYSHVLPDMQRDAADALDSVLRGA